MTNVRQFPVKTEWVRIQYMETPAFTETYGFHGNQGVINLEGILMLPENHTSKTLTIYMHASSTLQLLPVPQAMAQSGAHVLCAASRYPKNDAALIMEKVVPVLGAYIRHAKAVWGNEKIVLGGWSGGGSVALSYQSQAENPTITHPPAGDPANLKGAGLIPADAVVSQGGHLSSGHRLADAIAPSVKDELNPDDRDRELDIYDAANRDQPHYSAEFIAQYRAAQLARVRRITACVKQTLANLKERNTGEMERGFVVHRTLAGPRFLDPTLDPNDRKPRWWDMGNPETVNSGPVGLARFCTLRSWLSQWSIDDSRANGLTCGAAMRAPLLVIENSADDRAPVPHAHALCSRGFPGQDDARHSGRYPLLRRRTRTVSRGHQLTRDWLIAANCWRPELSRPAPSHERTMNVLSRRSGSAPRFPLHRVVNPRKALVLPRGG